MLRGPGGREGRLHRAARRRRPVRARDRLLEHGAETRPAYTTAGEPVPDEHAVGLPGYPGGGDIAGNWVDRQFQLDLFGESLLLLAEAARADRLDADGWRAAEVAAGAIAERWREPDAGIWELEPDEWTHSRLICVAGLRAIARRAVRAPRCRDGSRSRTRSRPTPPAALCTRAAAGSAPPATTASTPRCSCRRSAAPSRPMIRARVATLEAVDARSSTADGYAYRYRPDARPLGEAEGAFLFCGFLLALAWAQQGDEVAAARWFERNRAACGTARAARGGVRRHAAPAARQPAAGVRARAAARSAVEQQRLAWANWPLARGRAAYGAGAPARPADRDPRRRPDLAAARPVRVARVLGARHVAARRRPSTGGLRRARTLAGAAVDAAHAASMVALAVARPRWRRLAAADATVAARLAAAGVARARCGPGRGRRGGRGPRVP